jgi:hypothetical protein
MNHGLRLAQAILQWNSEMGAQWSFHEPVRAFTHSFGRELFRDESRIVHNDENNSRLTGDGDIRVTPTLLQVALGAWRCPRLRSDVNCIVDSKFTSIRQSSL